MPGRAALLVLALLTVPLSADELIVEPKSGVVFEAKENDLSLLGVGLRTKTFLKVRVYAVGFYVSDAALAGPLQAHKGDIGSPAFYSDLVQGDFPKEIRMKFLRDVTKSQIQDAFREVLVGVDPARLSGFVDYFGDTKTGEEYRLRWSSATSLEVTVAGNAKPTITDKAFDAAVLGIWLGPKPVQEDIKLGLIGRAKTLIK
jgi:hypothetical protein